MKIETITGAEVLALRKKLKLNQSQFWLPLGVTQSGGSRYESGRSIPKPVRQLIVIAYGTQAQAYRAVEKLRGVAE